MIVIGIAVIAIFIMVILLLVIYMRRGKKKLPPADVIPEVSVICILINYSSIIDVYSLS